MSLPCSYDEYITAWDKKFIKHDPVSKFESMTDRKFLLEKYKRGEREIAFDILEEQGCVVDYAEDGNIAKPVSAPVLIKMLAEIMK